LDNFDPSPSSPSFPLLESSPRYDPDGTPPTFIMTYPKTPIIAVIGTTGSGKSSFIRGITGSPDCEVGHTLHSQTTHVASYTLQTPSGSIHLADTPGFDDTQRTDYEILEELMSWLKRSGDALTAIVYLHPINHERLRGSSRKMIRTVQKMLGPQCFRMVLLVTTFWNEVEEAVGAAREKELLGSEDGWKPFRDGGATVERMGREYGQFVGVLERMAMATPMRTRAQEEMASGARLEDTMAGMALIDEDAAAVQRERLKKAKDQARAQGVKREKKAAEEQKSRGEAQRRGLQAEMRQKNESLRIKEQLAQQELRHKERMQQKHKDIEQQKKLEAALRAKAELERIEAERQEKERAIGALQNQAAVQFQASKIQQRRVEGVVDVLRIFLTTSGYPRIVWGINPLGRGMAGVGQHSQTLLNYGGIQRSGITVWCDCCRVSVGRGSSYGECPPKAVCTCRGLPADAPRKKCATAAT